MFHFQKRKFGKFILGISVWEERVPFATSSIRGSRGTPGHSVKNHERYGTGDKNNRDEKSVMEHKFSIGKFPPGSRDYLFRNSVYSGKFPVLDRLRGYHFCPVGIVFPV